MPCQRPAVLRLAERRPGVPVSVPDPSGSRSQMPPKGFIRAAMPHSWLEGNTQAPGGGLPASRMHQVSARAGPAGTANTPTNRHAPSIFLLSFIHGLRLYDLTLDKHRSRPETEQFQSAQVR